jgi:hypothetical protein
MVSPASTGRGITHKRRWSPGISVMFTLTVFLVQRGMMTEMFKPACQTFSAGHHSQGPRPDRPTLIRAQRGLRAHRMG